MFRSHLFSDQDEYYNGDDKCLVGTFTAEDVVTQSHVLAEFDGSTTCQEQGKVDHTIESSPIIIPS